MLAFVSMNSAALVVFAFEVGVPAVPVVEVAPAVRLASAVFRQPIAVIRP
jgi:hypothetical protein